MVETASSEADRILYQQYTYSILELWVSVKKITGRVTTFRLLFMGVNTFLTCCQNDNLLRFGFASGRLPSWLRRV